MLEIYSIHYNKPEYAKLQIDSFKKFINNDYSFTIIDNSINENISRDIKNICDENGIGYLKTDNKTPHDHMHYGWSHIYGLNYFKNLLLNSESVYIMLIEHDIFLCSDIEKMYNIVSENSICGVYQERGDINYLHPGLLFFNKPLCVNLNDIDFGGGHVENTHVDVGGQTHYYINRSDIKTFYIDNEIISSGLEDINGQIFYHMVDGSNWSNNSESINRQKLEKIKKIIYE